MDAWTPNRLWHLLAGRDSAARRSRRPSGSPTMTSSSCGSLRDTASRDRRTLLPLSDFEPSLPVLKRVFDEMQDAVFAEEFLELTV
jgi:hypothetical protein